MFLTYLTIDSAFVASLTTIVSNLFTDVSLVVMLAIGLPLAFWVIRKIIGLVRAR
jgi:hypothetical protein